MVSRQQATRSEVIYLHFAFKIFRRYFCMAYRLINFLTENCFLDKGYENKFSKFPTVPSSSFKNLFAHIFRGPIKPPVVHSKEGATIFVELLLLRKIRISLSVICFQLSICKLSLCAVSK